MVTATGSDTNTIFADTGTNISITKVAVSNFTDPTWYNITMHPTRWNTTDPNKVWDFTNVWNDPVAGVNNGYPTLK